MTTCACSATNLSAKNAFTKLDHCSRCAFGNWKAARIACTSVRVRALRRLGRSRDYFASRSRRARTGSDVRGVENRTAAIVNSVDSPANVVGNIERTIWTNGQPAWTMHGLTRRLRRSCEAIGEDLALTGCAVTVEWLKDHVVTTFRIWPTVP